MRKQHPVAPKMQLGMRNAELGIKTPVALNS